MDSTGWRKSSRVKQANCLYSKRRQSGWAPLCFACAMLRWKASYLTLYKIAAASKPFRVGEFIKTCMVKAAEVGLPWKATGFCKYQPDKKHNCRQDFQSFSGFGQPVKEQSIGFYGLFSCNWWKHGHYRCCTTGHFCVFFVVIIFKKPLSVLWLIVLLCLSNFLTVLKQKSKQSEVAIFKLHTIILLVRPSW